MVFYMNLYSPGIPVVC